ncbi:hypothetical protein GGR56DRAFT_620767 [Xylariaceae sp. FL0804]|nr:hypothetical protein GGR56DRAFT_620767 [Xylariaceae sp. FL0804]
MLPPGLSGSYQQYKSDTDSIAAWLASTAKSHGYPSDLLDHAPPKPGGGRLKGKARAKEKAKPKPAEATGSSLPKHTIRIKEFVPLAEFVAGKSGLKVPFSMKTTLDRVIRVRTGFGQRLAELGAEIDDMAAENHDYFVGVLEHVRQVLAPRFEQPPAAVDAASHAGFTMPEQLANRFAGLEVHEPSDDFLNAPDIERPRTVANDTTLYEAEQGTSLQDLLCLLPILFDDVNRMRSRINWIWKYYRDANLDLVAAAIATNTAIDLVRSSMADVAPLFKQHGGLSKVLTFFYLIQAQMNGSSLDSFAGTSFAGTLNIDYKNYDAADATYIMPCRIVSQFTQIMPGKGIPLYKDGYFGTYDPRDNRSSKSGEEKDSENRALLMAFFTEQMAVIRSVPGYPIEDEFLRGLKELDETKEIPFYLVFAAQIFLDIHHILREHADRGFNTLSKNMSFLGQEIEEYFKFHENLKISHWPESNDASIRGLKVMMKWIAEDPVHEVKIKTYRMLREPIPASMERGRLLKMSPVLSGLMLYNFRANMFHIGTAVADAWGSITYPMHLLNALNSEGLLQERWEDMYVAFVLLQSKLFVGDPPKTPADYYKRFCLQTGHSAAAFTNRRRDRVPIASRSGPRGGINDSTARVSSMFRNRYLQRRTGSPSADWTPEALAAIVDLGMFRRRETKGEDGHQQVLLVQMDRKEKREAQQAQARSAAAAAKDDARRRLISADELIHSLTFALAGESVEFALPYLALHREGWALLRAVRRRCDPVLRALHGPTYLERETELPFVVGWIFDAAANRCDARPLELAAEVVDEFARGVPGGGGGRKVVQALEALGIPVMVEEGE